MKGSAARNETGMGSAMKAAVSIVIPAWNEARTIGHTLRYLHEAKQRFCWWDELIVVDDGSDDGTAQAAMPFADKVIVLEANRGKGAALAAGCQYCSHPIVLLLDADLGPSVELARHLLPPLIQEQADMTIAKFPKSQTKAGFGLVKKLATVGIYMLCGYETEAPLSGQRAIRKTMLSDVHFAARFGVEVGLTIDAVRRGYVVKEVEIAFRHRETGRDWRGFMHRGKQFVEVFHTLVDRWLRPIC